MYLLPENSKRRESVIASVTAALVGIAMIAIAGKASAMYADAPHPNHGQHYSSAHDEHAHSRNE